MAQYLGTVKLGGFYNNGAILKRPTKPWRPDDSAGGNSGYGDIPQMSGSMANYTFTLCSRPGTHWVTIVLKNTGRMICEHIRIQNMMRFALFRLRNRRDVIRFPK